MGDTQQARWKIDVWAEGDLGLRVVALVRHGQTDWNVAGRLQGRTDVPLNEEGIRQAERAAEEIARLGPWDGLVASPLRRATATAEEIARRLGLPVQLDPRLVEREYGVLEGLTRSEREALYPHSSPIPGVESHESLHTRAVTFLRDCLRGPYSRFERLVAVSHGGWINALLYHVSGGTVGSGITRVANGSITLLAWRAEGSVPRERGHWVIQSLGQLTRAPHG